ncbi:MAG: hypothetical protein AAF939_07340 [Planctomycetota bacterium]
MKKQLIGKKVKCQCGTKFTIQASQFVHDPARVSVPSSINQKQSGKSGPRKSGPDKPLFDDEFSDMDAILSGTGDAAPITVANDRPAAAPAGVLVRQAPVVQPAPKEKPKPRQPGYQTSGTFFLAFISGVLAVWLGAFVVVSRFKFVEVVVLSFISEQLRNGFRGDFGMFEMPATISNLFVGLGWLLWGVGLGLIIFGALQVVSAFVQIVIRKPLFWWVDGLVMFLGFLAVLSLIGMIANQYWFQSQLMASLQPVEGDPFGALELDAATQIEDEFKAIKTKFVVSMLLCLVPAVTLTGMSLMRLFFKGPVVDSGP